MSESSFSSTEQFGAVLQDSMVAGSLDSLEDESDYGQDYGSEEEKEKEEDDF